MQLVLDFYKLINLRPDNGMQHHSPHTKTGTRKKRLQSHMMFTLSGKASTSKHVPIDLKEKIRSKWGELHDKSEILGRDFPWQPSICRVPEHLRKLNENAYTPWRVSIGPYHHNNPKFWLMEEHKLEYMEALIDKSRNKSLEEYIEVIRGLEPKARLCYADQMIEKFNQDDFVEMLLVDGCFIVEFLLRKIRKLGNVDNEPTKIVYDEMYAFIQAIFGHDLRYDFIFQSTRTSFEVRRDLILLENQIPYNVLERLYDLTFEVVHKPPFYEVVYCALRTSIPSITNILGRKQLIERMTVCYVANLVSFLKICCRPSSKEEVQIPIRAYNRWEPACFCTFNGKDMKGFRVPNVTLLAKAGIGFKASNSPLLEINFSNGVLVMPALIIWHHTDTFIRNVMAYELYSTEATVTTGTTISDYMCFMDDLINSKEDVAILVKAGIIHNWLESDEAVSDMFKSITKHILADHASYSKICKDLNEYIKQPIRKYMAILRQDYFNQPWAIVYFITGVLIQTTATIIKVVTDIRSNE